MINVAEVVRISDMKWPWRQFLSWLLAILKSTPPSQVALTSYTYFFPKDFKPAIE